LKYPALAEETELSAEGLKDTEEEKDYSYYHLNAIELLPETPLGMRDPRFRPGNWLICLKNVNLIAILDKETKEIVWHWGVGELDFPHMPRMLENGNMLIFDNGKHRDYSRVLELNPVNYQIVWEYIADPPQNFHSEDQGCNQRLPNGNTLICESNKGRGFEITDQGDIVWNFLSPDIGKKGRRRNIYRMTRYSKDFIEPLLSHIEA